MSSCITQIHLKSDGETLVLQTALWEGTFRKQVVKIWDIQPHPEPTTVFEKIADAMESSFFMDHYPVIIGEEAYLIYKNGFVNCDKMVQKAILNGYPIDVQEKTTLTQDLLDDEYA